MKPRKAIKLRLSNKLEIKYLTSEMENVAEVRRLMMDASALSVNP
jgi:hypothetical protein